MIRWMSILFVLVATPALAFDAAQYYAATCATCHGPAGAGDGPASAGLPVKPASFADPAFWASRDDALVEKAIREGGPAVGKSPLMAPLGAALSDGDMSALVALLKGFVPAQGVDEPPAPTPPAKPGSADLTTTTGAQLLPEPDPAMGEALYRTRCAVCHGRNGDGAGPAARGMDPRPRDLVAGVYRFTSTPLGQPAAREDLFRVVTHGMRGTAMPGWNGLPATDRWQLVYHLESLSPRFDDGPGAPFEIPPTPAASAALVAAGGQVYATAGCVACHGPGGRGPSDGSAALRDSTGRRIKAADMTRGWRFKGGSDPSDIYRTLTAGIDGTPMPSFAHLSEDDRWALVHWIREQFADADVALR